MCDVFLEQCFGVKKIRFMEIPQRLHQLLSQPDPLVLNHVIQHNEGGAEKNTACYDIGRDIVLKLPERISKFHSDVEVEDPMKQHMASFIHSQQNQQEIASLDQKIFDIVEQVESFFFNPTICSVKKRRKK